MQKRRKSTKSTYRLLGILFVVILAAFFVVNILTRDQESSDMENRSLAQRPSLSWESVTSGTYMERFESYVSDQFVGRNVFREIYIGFRRLGGSREENDVYRGRGGQLMEDIAVPDEELLRADVEGLNAYVSSYPEVQTHVLLVPDAAEILSDRLPRLASVADQGELFDELHRALDSSIVWMDGIEAMNAYPEDQRYYQTDPHWTTLGAYDVFLETAGDLDIEHPDEVAYEPSCAAYDFNGTLAATSGFLLGKDEEVTVYLADNETPYLVTYVEETERSPSLYRVDALDTRDKYAVFFGGNHSLIEIETAAEDSRTLLVVKDSFANAYIPFLIPYYSRILVVDPRYYDGDIAELTDTYSVTDTLFLYSGNTFFTDANLQTFLSSDAAFASTDDGSADSAADSGDDSADEPITGTISEE